MRILHIIDPGSPGGGACTLQLLSEPLQRLTSVDQDVLLIGNNAHEALARRCGVEPTGRINTPHNQPLFAGLGSTAFKRFLSHYESAGGAYDLIHCWTPRSLLLAATAAPNHRRLATFAVGPVNGVLMRVLAATLRTRPTTMSATTVSVKRDFVVMGMDESMLGVLPPAVHPEAVEQFSDDRDTVREKWGVPEDSFVVALVAEPANWCDARRAAGVLSLLVESGRDVRLVVHPRAQRRIEARQWLDRMGMGQRMILEDNLGEPWRYLRGLDALLSLSDDSNTVDLRERGTPFSILFGGGRTLRPMPGVMPALWAMGAGVPVVAEASMAMEEIIEHEQTGLLIPTRDINAAADCLVRLHDDSAFHSDIAQAARAHVRHHYHVSAYCVRLKDAYEQVISGRIARVPLEGEDHIEQRNVAAS